MSFVIDGDPTLSSGEMIVGEKSDKQTEIDKYLDDT
jgi:hypothetical protein